MKNIIRKLAVAICMLLILAPFFQPWSYAEDVYTDNVVIVLDCSGSMREPMYNTDIMKLNAAKSALKDVLKQVQETTHIGLLQFSAGNTSKEWLYPLGVKKDVEFMNAIDTPKPGGNTPLGKYMKIGADRLLQEREKQHGYGSYRLLVVTDGESTESPCPVDSYTQDIISRGIIIDAVVINMDRAHTLATKVHSYRSANNPGSLKKALAEEFAEVGSVKNDATGKEVFELIAPLPSEVAAAILQALSASGNHPIGEKPKPKQEPQAQAGQDAQQGQSGATASQDHSAALLMWVIIGVVVIALLALLGKLLE